MIEVFGSNGLTRPGIQGRAKAAPNPSVGGDPSQNEGPTFYFTTTTLKVGIVDQCWYFLQYVEQN